MGDLIFSKCAKTVVNLYELGTGSALLLKNKYCASTLGVGVTGGMYAHMPGAGVAVLQCAGMLEVECYY